MVIKKYIRNALLCGTILNSALTANAVYETDTLNIDEYFAKLEGADVDNIDLSEIFDLLAQEVKVKNIVVDGKSYGAFEGTVLGALEHTYSQLSQAEQQALKNEVSSVFDTISGIMEYADDLSMLDGLNIDEATQKAIQSGDIKASAEVLEALLNNPSIRSQVLSSSAALEVNDGFVSQGILASVGSVTSLVDSRLMSVSGVGSGDENNTYGLWLKGIASRATQKANKDLVGYKASGRGFTIGADIDLDNAVLGVAYSMIKGDSTAKTSLKNKANSTMHLATIYGSAELGSRFTVDAQGRFGAAKIKKTHANAANTNVSAKPKAKLYGGTVRLAYDYVITDNVSLVPSVGISHDQVKVKGYTESGSGVKRKINSITATKTSGLVGLGLKHAADFEGGKLISEIHGIADIAVKNKTSNTKVTLMNINNAAEIDIKAGKMPKQSYKIGGSINAAMNSVDLGLGYDFGVAKKYQAHSGYIKARINL